MSVRPLMYWYAAWMAALAVAFFLAPSHHMIIWGAIGVSSAGAVLLGVWRNKPRKKAPWLLISASILVFCAGDATYNVLTEYLGQSNPFPSLADFWYLMMYVLLAAGTLGLSKAGAAGRDRIVMLDALIFTAGLGLLWWIFLINPQLSDPTRSLTERLISIAYPLGDVLLLAVVGRLITVVRASPAVLLMVVGMVGLLVADVLYGLIQLHGEWTVGSPVDLGWIVFYAAWGAASLHPSMADLTEPRMVKPRDTGVRYLVILTLFLIIPVGVLILSAIAGGSGYQLVVAVFLAVTFLLVTARLLGVINGYRRNIVRGRGIRAANAALLSATDADGVIWALRRAADRLLPPDTPHRVLLIMNDGSKPELFSMRPAGGARLCYTQTLPLDLAGRLGGFDITLICPLALEDRPSGDPHIGALLIAADEVSLGFLQTPMELVASQAALTLERIMLSAEVTQGNSEQYFRTLVQNATDVILIVEPDGDTIRYASPSAQTVFGRSELAGLGLHTLIDTPAADLTVEVFQLVGKCEEDGDPARGNVVDWTVRRPDGTTVQAEVSCRDLRSEPTVGGLVVTLRDVTDQRRLGAELTYRAFHDSLTGLANRVLFAERIRQAVDRSRDTGAVVGVLFMDLDDFKVVNDTFGHEYGDKLLNAVSKRLTGALRPQDTAARLGGDEFAALIEDATSAEAVERVAERVVGALREPFAIGERMVTGAASIGVAISDNSGDGQDLLRQADLALYAAKNAGKGQWRRYLPSLHTARVRRLELRAALDQAIADGALTLEFQPIVALRSGATAGFEALVRWQHPTRGLLLPDQFIEVAEESGLIVPMGAWVLNEAITAAVRWRAATGPGGSPYVSINVSARQFRAPGFVQNVRAALDQAGLPANRLMLEITESLVLRDDDQVWDDLAELRRTGVYVAIDDFGTGYSSLSYLRHVPLDALKIDRLFTSTIVASGQQAALVDGIVKLAHTLGLEVIAEGIERDVERDLLTRFGCRYGQGFLYSQSLASQDALDWIVRERTTGTAPGGALVS